MTETEIKTETGGISWVEHPGVGLFLASFLALFLELLIIRWVPSVVRIVAYYGNVMLLSSFLGLGCGVLLARRKLRLQRLFAPLLLLLVASLSLLAGVRFAQGPDELRFLFEGGAMTTTLPIVTIFSLNALLFVPLGDLIGVYFTRLPPLRAYGWDLAGALAGTVLFGLFSYWWFSPVVGFLIPMAVFLLYCTSKPTFGTATICFVATMTIMVVGQEEHALWSPYNELTVRRIDPGGAQAAVSDPPADLRTMVDPPFYTVEVNDDFYFRAGTLDLTRFSEQAPALLGVEAQYGIPHQVRPGADQVLIVGSGGGHDVEAALLAGASHVDAVEIDPVILDIGRRFAASGVYEDPRVSLHDTDGRAFLRQTDRSYDMVVFGFLDSQGLFSQMSSIRLDGYVYTRESFREAFAHVREGGVLSVSFFSAGRAWLTDRLASMLSEATGAKPLMYYTPNGQVILIAGKGHSPSGPAQIRDYLSLDWAPGGTAQATDDWPYLYLRSRAIPMDYLLIIGFLTVVSALFVLTSSGRGEKHLDLHFFFLGAGFLLLETKSITTLSLYFGTTWFVSMIAIAGVLIMVFLANLVAAKLQRASLLFYVPLAASILFLYLFPASAPLAWSSLARLVYSLVVMPLPIFFAGIVFSSTFRESADTGFSFGSNMLGAMFGGLVEYLGMITGSRALLLVVLGFYAASLTVRWLGLRAQSGGAGAAGGFQASATPSNSTMM